MVENVDPKSIFRELEVFIHGICTDIDDNNHNNKDLTISSLCLLCVTDMDVRNHNVLGQ